ncbi:hypothetical protein LR48_Vigan08g005300 [Vigna angularis]|uniref:Uncharacterized protein n=1 Tax=Phaseolus angularis TaxID=3914 RepID=A0A0L9V2P0_PHAAN|nr:hypothetical protein LR48_Vigan08g005300 [Vigna angularis]
MNSSIQHQMIFHRGHDNYAENDVKVDGNDTNVDGLVERLPRSSRQRKRKNIIDDSNDSVILPRKPGIPIFADRLRERSSIKKPNYILDELEEDLDIFTANMGTLQKTLSKLKEVTLTLEE